MHDSSVIVLFESVTSPFQNVVITLSAFSAQSRGMAILSYSFFYKKTFLYESEVTSSHKKVFITKQSEHNGPEKNIYFLR